MCLAIPGRVVAIDGRSARVDYAGVQREALLDLAPETAVGDFVLVHAGFVIRRMEATEAGEILDQFRQILAAAPEEKER